MTKEEIKASIAANIAGQFNQIDISGKLAGILEGIVDAIPEGPYDLTGKDLSRDPVEITEEEHEALVNSTSIKVSPAVMSYGGEILPRQLPPDDAIYAGLGDVFDSPMVENSWGASYFTPDGLYGGEYIFLVFAGGKYFVYRVMHEV